MNWIVASKRRDAEKVSSDAKLTDVQSNPGKSRFFKDASLLLQRSFSISFRILCPGGLFADLLVVE